MKIKLKRKLSGTFRVVLLFVASLIVVFPLYWAVINSLKPYKEIYSFPPTYVPKSITFDHFKVIKEMAFSKYLLNSMIVSTMSAFLSILIAMLPAYTLSKYHMSLKKLIETSVILLQLLPMVVFIVPIFKFLKFTGLLNSFIGLSLSYIPFITPVMVMFLRGYFTNIPKTIEEAAIIDGCSRISAFFRIVFPISLPGIFSAFIYAFLTVWGELMFAMSFLTDPDKQTIPVFLSLFIGQYQTRWGPLFAGSVLATLPTLILFAFLQRYFISGLTAGALKD